jgi:hypothetical protein
MLVAEKEADGIFLGHILPNSFTGAFRSASESPSMAFCRFA